MCPDPISPKEVSRYECEDSSLGVATLLNIVDGLKILPEADDARRLARFFLGPEASAIEDAIEATRLAEKTVREARATFLGLSGSGRRR